MRIYKRLFLSDDISQTQDDYILQIKENKSIKGLYLILLSESNTEMLEILRYNDLKASKKESFIVGIAKNKNDAFILCSEIIRRIYEATSDVRVKEYFSISDFY